MSTSRALAATSVSQLSVDPEVSVSLAKEAYSKAHTNEAEVALLSGLNLIEHSPGFYIAQPELFNLLNHDDFLGNDGVRGTLVGEILSTSRPSRNIVVA